MDTKTLVVGQDVCMRSGPQYGTWGKVVKVTPSGQVDVLCNEELFTGNLLHFDANGRSYVTELPSFYDPTAHPSSPWGWNGNGTYEFGPWELYDDDPALYVEARQRARAANIKHAAELRRKSEERKRDWKALYERAAQAAQGEGSTKITSLGDFLTVKEFELAERMWKESEHDYASRIAKRIIEPNIARINAELGQENSPMYLAYVAEYIMKTARCTLPM